MRVFKISGRVINGKTLLGISGLRIEVWDKDFLIDDFVGNDTTKSNGTFHISFDDSASYYRELFIDRRPDLYFKIFKGTKLLKSTEDSVVWNVDREDINLDIEIQQDETGGTDMSDTNSQSHISARSILQATYTPRKPLPEQDPSQYPRGLEKVALFNRLSPTVDELDALVAQYSGSNQEAVDTISIIRQAISENSRIDVWVSGLNLAYLDVAILNIIVLDLIRLRQQVLASIASVYQTILQQFNNQPTTTRSLLPAWNVSPILINTRMVLEWAIENGVEAGLASQALSLSRSLSVNIDVTTPDQYLSVSMRQIDQLRLSTQAQLRNLQVEALGYLHLERLSFAPAGIERGELEYSLPLAPGEEVNVRHREWSQITEEFERIVTDYLENFSEEGVTEKTDLSQTVSSQTQHSSAFNASLSTSGSAWGWNISASAGFNASDSASSSAQQTRNQSRELTSKASSRAKKEHKVSFRVASARETEDEAVKRIKNPFPDRAVRIDYFQLIRKWRVDLFRYGIRLTWDLIIPEPGAGLLSKLQEILDVRRKLEQEFIFPLALETNAEGYPILTDQNFRLEATKYGAILDKDPQRETDEIVVNDVHNWRDEGGAFKTRYYPIQVEINNGYTVAGIYVVGEVSKVADDQSHSLQVKAGKGILYNYYRLDTGDELEETPWDINNPFDYWNGRTGTISFSINIYNIDTQDIAIHVLIRRMPEAYESWRMQTFTIIRTAAQSLYYEERQTLKGRLARLEEELGSQDALSLRRKEREEVMRLVLEVLDFSPTEDQYREDPRVIRFLNQAIEWENMLYFLYPYFWSDPKKASEVSQQNTGANSEYWEFKKYLDHPDANHQAFLKAGAARVVLTIRPGFEEAFLAFHAMGDFEKVPPTPYLEIGQDFRNFAQTNYPGIPAANPITNYRPLLTWRQKQAWADMEVITSLIEKYHEVFKEYPSAITDLEKVISENETIPTNDPWNTPYIYRYPGNFGEYDLASYGEDGEEGGEGENADITNWAEASLIGTWYEYTPTSALDIGFNEQLL